jgi:hypothetical protein
MMKRIASVLISMLLASGTNSFATAGEGVAVHLPIGSYINWTGIEPEWSMELHLRGDGGATYTVTTREPGASPSTKTRAIFPGRWERAADVLTIRFSEDGAAKELAYQISECVYYVSNTSVRCSPGLEPATITTSHMFSQQLIYVVNAGPRPK